MLIVARLLRGVLLAVLGVFAFYLVVANAVITTGLLQRWIHGAQDNLHLHWRLAYTLLPGYVVAHDVVITTRDSAVETQIALERASTQLHLLAFFDRTFATGPGEARGARVWIRETRPLEELCAFEPGMLPPIRRLAQPARDREGAGACLEQADTALRAGPPSPPERLWQIRLERIALEDLREVWFDQDRLTLHAFGALSFELWPTQRLEIGRLRAAFDDGALARGEQVLAEAITGDLELSVPPVDLEDDPLRGVAEALSARVTLDADVKTLGLIDSYFGQGEWLQVGEGAGRLSARLAAARGQLLPGSTLRVRDASLSARAFEQVAAGRGRLDLEVRQTPGEDAEAHLELVLGDLRVRRARDRAPHLRAKELRLEARAPRPSITRALEEVELSAKLRGAELPDLRRYQAFVPEHLALELLGGRATASGELFASRGGRSGRGRFDLASSEVEARWEDARIAGQLALEVPIRSANLRRARFDITGARFTVEEGRVAEEERPSSPFAAQLEVKAGELHLDANDRPLTLEVAIQAELSSVRPVLALYGAGGKLPGWVRRLDPGALRGTFSLALTPDHFSLEQLVLRAGALEARAHLYSDEEATSGALLLGSGPLRVGLEIEDGETRLELLNPTNRYHRRARELRERAR